MRSLICRARRVLASRAEQKATRSTRIDSTMSSRSGHDRGLAVQGRPGRGLGVDRVGLAPLAAHLAVRSVHLHDLDAVGLEVVSEPGAVGTGALDADPGERAKALEPPAQGRVALRGGFK